LIYIFLIEAKKALRLHNKSKQVSMEQYLCCGQNSLLDLENKLQSNILGTTLFTPGIGNLPISIIKNNRNDGPLGILCKKIYNSI
jgi:hypothetical protein